MGRKLFEFPARDLRRGPRPTGGPTTFEEALSAHLDSLYAAACRLVRDPSLAEDLVQETALRAYRSFADLRSHDRFRAWLFTILHNAARTLTRDAARKVPFVDVDLDSLLEDPLLSDTEPNPEEAVIEQGRHGDLEADLRSLPDPFLRVLWLVDVEEFTIAEAAGILSIPPGTAASRLHRAHRALRARRGAGGPRPPRGEGGTP